MEESRNLLREGRLEEALQLTKEIDKQNKANTVTLIQLATIHNRLGQFRQEAEVWERFVLIAPRPEEACPDLPRAYERAHIREKALEASRRCIGFDPGSLRRCRRPDCRSLRT